MYKLNYRAEIDGLRAIAVVSVILYHAQMVLFGRDWFEGGFIGVDIFFVISGYLITRIILSELESKGSFSFLNFYERRARRILPMLFVVVFVSIPFAWQKLLPSDFVEYAESILASLFFGSNFFFYFSTTEYGADSALLKPFLHTWSLGVEEQFYLVFPILAIVAFKYFRKHFLTILVGLSLLSLQFSELMEVRNSDLNFYLPFSRFWELAMGSMLAYRELYYKPSNEGFASKSLPMLGLYLIAYSILFFDGKTPHPSFHTLIPIIGVALIIGFASKDEFVGRVLGSKPFVWVGLISYSAYLWHFPIFAFSRMGTSTIDNYDKLELISVTIVLSIVSYFLVESPFRKRFGSKSFAVVIASVLIFIVLFAVYAIKSEGIKDSVRLGFNYSITDTVERPNEAEFCKKNKVEVEGDIWCAFGNLSSNKIDFAVIGDSHSASSILLLESIATEKGLKGILKRGGGCPALLGVYPFRGKIHPNDEAVRCKGINDQAFNLAQKDLVDKVILISRWDYYVGNGPNGEREMNKITDESLVVGDLGLSRDVYSKSVDHTVQLYSETNTSLVVLLQVPHQKINPKRILEDVMDSNSIDGRKQKLKDGISLSVSLSEHKQRQSVANSAWLKYQNLKSIFIIDPTAVFCIDGICPMYDNTVSFYYDDDHASTNGFERLRHYFDSVL